MWLVYSPHISTLIKAQITSTKMLILEALEEAREKLASLQTKRRRSTRTQAALEAAVLAM